MLVRISSRLNHCSRCRGESAQEWNRSTIHEARPAGESLRLAASARGCEACTVAYAPSSMNRRLAASMYFAFDVGERLRLHGSMPADVGEMHCHDRLRKLHRHALRDGAAAITTGHHELLVAQHFGHEPMQQLRRITDRGNLARRRDRPVKAKPGSDGTTTSNLGSSFIVLPPVR